MGPPPREAGTVLRFRSMWTVVGALVIAGSVVGAVISREALVCGVVAAVGLLNSISPRWPMIICSFGNLSNNPE